MNFQRTAAESLNQSARLRSRNPGPWREGLERLRRATPPRHVAEATPDGRAGFGAQEQAGAKLFGSPTFTVPDAALGSAQGRQAELDAKPFTPVAMPDHDTVSPQTGYSNGAFEDDRLLAWAPAGAIGAEVLGKIEAPFRKRGSGETPPGGHGTMI